MNLDDPETLAKVIAEAIDDEELERVGEKGEELLYAPNHHKPYTGWRKVMADDGRIIALTQCGDGKLDGLSIGWSSNGRKEEESTWKDGKIMTYVVFKPNGEKCPETKVVNGNGVLVFYDDDGKVATRATCRDGEVVFGSGQTEEEEEEGDDEENVSATMPKIALNCLPPFAFIGGLAYCMEKYWGMDLEDPDSNVLIILFVAFWVIAVGWFYFVDFIKKIVVRR
jgi:antitoxin component YwqK of YwqJK toxin-antitoxin module